VAVAVALLLVGCADQAPPTGPQDEADIVQLRVWPQDPTVQMGDSIDFVAFGLTALGDTTLVEVVWSAQNGELRSNGKGHGLYKPRGRGRDKVKATADTLADSTTVTVTEASVASVEVVPGSAGIDVGSSVQLGATVRDSAGNELTGRTVDWSSSDPSMATVSGSGLVSGVAAGTATITATSEGQSSSAQVTVMDTSPPPVASVEVTPATVVLVVGTGQRLTAIARDAAGNEVEGSDTSWATSDGAIATVNQRGRVTGVAPGTVTVMATIDGQSGTASVTVTSVPVASVDVTPSSLSLSVGQTGQLTATPRDAAGNPLSGRVVTWSTSNGGVATVNGSGLVTAQGAGTATVTATSEGQSGSAQVTVTAVPVASVDVTPSSLSLSVGQTGQLTATPRDAAGNALSGRVVTWSTSNGGVATVNGSGLVTAQGAGTATVAATSEGQSGSAQVTVTAAGAISGLDFPGNVSYPSESPSIIFTWNQSRSGAAPFPAYPATYIWRAYPREQNPGATQSYWTFLFHSRYESFPFQGATEYYGMHPYPDQGNGVNYWEISSHGGDTYQDAVVFNQWYTQVAVVYESGGREYHTYYWNWPNTTTDVVSADRSNKSAAPDPAIIIGDAPWNPGFENPNAVLRGFQFYDVALTPAQIAQEIAAPGSHRTPWYLNLNPTPNDISDKSGNGHHPAWVGARRPQLWTGTGSPAGASPAPTPATGDTAATPARRRR
jgi:uncharacterized protein YjdB